LVLNFDVFELWTCSNHFARVLSSSSVPLFRAQMESRIQAVCDEVRRRLQDDFEAGLVRAKEQSREHEQSLKQTNQMLRQQLDQANMQLQQLTEGVEIAILST
jgi:hypothetical protein